MGLLTALRGTLPATVITLGLVSLLTDLSSEMIYPLLPLYLTGVLGAGALALGVIEGIAEATAALLKILGGYVSDRTRRRKPLVVLGYSVSSLARPLVGLATAWPMVLSLRFADRVGKGLRSAPRDALIADVTAPHQRGHAFGLHRAMDHAGAVLGPLVAAALLTGLGLPLRTVFLLAAVPGLAVVLLVVLGVREPLRPVTPPAMAEQRPVAPPPAGANAPAAAAGAALPPALRRLLVALGVFTLGNSTDAFLLLQLSRVGIAPAGIAVLWAAHHGVKMAAVFAIGKLSDRLPRRRLLGLGWAIYAIVYAGFALVNAPLGLVALFLAYGLYFGFAEPVERGWVAALAPEGSRGRAFGVYYGTVGLVALPASLLFGWLLETVGPAGAFGCGAGLALVALLLLARVPEASRPATPAAGQPGT